MSVIVAHRQALHFPEQVVPDCLDNLQRNRHHQPRLQIGGAHAHQVDDSQYNQRNRHIGGHSLDRTGSDPVLHHFTCGDLRQNPVRDFLNRAHGNHCIRIHCQCQVIDNRRHQVTAAQARHRGNQHAQQHQHQLVPVLAHVAQQPSDGLSRILGFACHAAAGRASAGTSAHFSHIPGFGRVLLSQSFK